MYNCEYFLVVAYILDEPEARDHHIARFIRLVRHSYQRSRSQYAPVQMNNRDLAVFWGCTEFAARDTLADMKRFGWIDTKQIGQRKRDIVILAAWRKKEKDGAEGINAPSPSDLHLVAQATAAQLPARKNDIHKDAPAEGATDSRTLNDPLNVVVGTISNDLDKTYQQQHTNPVRTAAEGATDSRTLKETNRIIDALWDLDIRTEDAIDIILGKTRERFKGGYRDYSHVTPEYLEDWVVHRQITKEKLGGGFYRMQIREKRASPYRMSAKQRAEYRADCERARTGGDDEPVEEQIKCDQLVADEMPTEAGDASTDAQHDMPAPQPLPYRADGTAELWDKTLGELKLQMTKATFETWVKSSHALGWDDATGEIVIAVHSPYAKEWLEARLTTTVLRTVRGIVERDVAVRYEVA